MGWGGRFGKLNSHTSFFIAAYKNLKLNDFCEWKISIWSQRWFQWFDQTISLNNQPKRMAGRFHNQHFPILASHTLAYASTYAHTVTIVPMLLNPEILCKISFLTYQFNVMCSKIQCKSFYYLFHLCTLTHTHIQWRIRTHRVANFNSSKAKQSKAMQKKERSIYVYMSCVRCVSVCISISI